MSDYTPPWLRKPDCLRAAVRQFDVEHNRRYAANQQGWGETYCNIFVWDCTRALECEIPHVHNRAELTALGMLGWLQNNGVDAGWYQVDRLEGWQRANAGYPVVAAWENPSHYPDGRRRPSHVAVLIPSPDMSLRIAQAGAINFYDGPLERGFGFARGIQYWTHP